MIEPSTLPTSPEGSTPGQQLLTVAEACASLRISRWTFYRLVQARQLETVKIGSARRVPATALHQFVDKLRQRESDDAA